MNNNEDEEFEKDVLKLQVHSLPLNLNWNQSDEEEDEDDDESVQDFPSNQNSNQELPTYNLPLNSTSESTHSLYDSHDDSEDEELIDLSTDFAPNPLNLLKLNFAYQEVIEQQISLVDRLLQENHYKKSVLAENLSRASVESNKPPRLECALFNKLLFKDERGCGPNNPDIERIKDEIGPGFVPNFLPPAKWKKATDQELTSGVVAEAQRVLMEPLLAQLEYIQEKIKASESDQLKSKVDEVKAKIQAVKSLPRDQLIGDRNKDWDWDSISNIALNNQQDPINCALRWKNYLHPSINRGPWKKDEDEKLFELVQKHKDCNWKVIAEELGTNRTVVDVVRRYQLKINSSFKSRPWTPEEDFQLLQLISKYRVGNVIPYTQIALHMKNRHATQIVHRWTKSLDPSIKRHRFTPQEDAALLRAVLVHGQKWSRIRDLGLIPGRNDAQLRERYMNVLDGTRRRSSWTRDEDLELIDLVKKIGEGNWTAIASRMKNRADCQCLRRWNALKQHLKTGHRLSYRSDKKKVIKLMKVRDNLRRAIGAEHEARKRESREAVNRELEETSEGTMNTDALIQVYDDLSQTEPTGAKKVCFMTQSDPVFKELNELTDIIYQPRCVEATRQGTPLSHLRDGVIRRSKDIGPKDIFVHFIKALNINAERTLNKIKRKSRKDEANTNKKNSPFMRNLYLPLCAPNRATTRAYRTLSKDRERRVNQAKTILNLPDAEEPNAENYDPETLLADLRATYKYKIFRSRFNALFTWPTLLSSLVPYLRKTPEGTLYAAVRKRKIIRDQPPAKKRKIAVEDV